MIQFLFTFKFGWWFSFHSNR